MIIVRQQNFSAFNSTSTSFIVLIVEGGFYTLMFLFLVLKEGSKWSVLILLSNMFLLIFSHVFLSEHEINVLLRTKALSIDHLSSSLLFLHEFLVTTSISFVWPRIKVHSLLLHESFSRHPVRLESYTIRLFNRDKSSMISITKAFKLKGSATGFLRHAVQAVNHLSTSFLSSCDIRNYSLR